MAQVMGVRAPSVTVARVIIYIVAALGALGGLAMLGLGVVGLVSGASVASRAAGSDAEALGGLFGSLIAAFAGVALVVGVFQLVVSGLWFWVATALGRGSRAAQVVATVLCGLDVVFGLLATLIAATNDEAGSAGLALLFAVALPGTIIALLWAPASARAFFATPRAVVGGPVGPAWQAPPPAWHQQPGWAPQQTWARPGPAPLSPPVGVPAPVARHAAADDADPVTTPTRLPALCARCGTTLAPAAAHCGACGAPTAARPVGA